MLSTMLQSKILRTKKRLYSDPWLLPVQIIGIVGLMGTMGFTMRASTISWNFGVVQSQLPILLAPLDDPGYTRVNINHSLTLNATTPALVLTEDYCIFGDLQSVTENFSEVRNKFKIAHKNGRPQIDVLFKQMNKWVTKRERIHGISNQGILVLIPSPYIPNNIIIQLMSWFKTKKSFSRVILAGGIH